jgi:integrase
MGNPARDIEMFPEKPRERLLTAEELGRLGAALDATEKNESEHASVIACIRLLILTGARLSEILTLKWEYVDFEHGVARLPDSKTGRKTIYLSAPALAVLQDIPRLDGNPYIIAGHGTRKSKRKGADGRAQHRARRPQEPMGGGRASGWICGASAPRWMTKGSTCSTIWASRRRWSARPCAFMTFGTHSRQSALVHR